MSTFLDMILPANWKVVSSHHVFNTTNDAQKTYQGRALTWNQKYPNIDAAGLVALADLTTIARRTVLTGTSCFLDLFVLCPGIHRQQSAMELNGGEYPAVAAMTTGYAFRVENPATVVYLQKVGRTGRLTTLTVSKVQHSSWIWRHVTTYMLPPNDSVISTVSYLMAAAITIASLSVLAISSNRWGLGVFLILMLARLCNIVITRRRCELGWAGAKEPGVKGDLLVLLSQDRWIRMRGLVDDLKAVTSGQWLRDMSFIESSITAFATVLVYLDAALASNMDQSGKVILLIVLVVSASLLAVANEFTEDLQMKGFILKVDKRSKHYDRRRTLAEELIAESGRRDWALRLGMVVPETGEVPEKDLVGVTM